MAQAQKWALRSKIVVLTFKIYFGSDMHLLQYCAIVIREKYHFYISSLLEYLFSFDHIFAVSLSSPSSISISVNLTSSLTLSRFKAIYYGIVVLVMGVASNAILNPHQKIKYFYYRFIPSAMSPARGLIRVRLGSPSLKT